MSCLFAVILGKEVNAQWVPTDRFPSSGGGVFSLTSSGTNVFNGGIFLTTDNGTSWTEKNSGLTNKSVYSLTVSGSNVFAGTDDGVFVTTNNGSNWECTEYDYLSVYALTISEM